LGAAIPDGNPCELGVHGRKKYTVDWDVGIDRRAVAKFIVDGMRVLTGHREVRDAGEGHAPAKLAVSVRIIRHGDGGDRYDETEKQQAGQQDPAKEGGRRPYRAGITHGDSTDLSARYHGRSGGGNSCAAFL